jgi:FkbM family methyltransferase
MYVNCVLQFPKKFVKYILAKFNLKLIRLNANSEYPSEDFAYDLSRAKENAKLILASKHHLGLIEAIEIIESTKSQLGQDVLALAISDFKSDGYFVEFGATNGIDFSNTYMLEKLGWSGILAEPAQIWHTQLAANRPNSLVSTECVWAKSGEFLLFSEVESAGVYSTLNSFKDGDNHALIRKDSREYQVLTISLLDLLRKFEAPKRIDFLSIDTEGSEFEIIRDFDFNEYAFKLICIEHNYSSNREKIHGILAKSGYSRIFEEMSLFDDWYVNTL